MSDKPAPQALADFLDEYCRDNVSSVSCANYFDAASAMLRSQHVENKRLTAIETAAQQQLDMLDGIDPTAKSLQLIKALLEAKDERYRVTTDEKGRKQ